MVDRRTFLSASGLLSLFPGTFFRSLSKSPSEIISEQFLRKLKAVKSSIILMDNDLHKALDESLSSWKNYSIQNSWYRAENTVLIPIVSKDPHQSTAFNAILCYIKSNQGWKKAGSFYNFQMEPILLASEQKKEVEFADLFLPVSEILPQHPNRIHTRYGNVELHSAVVNGCMSSNISFNVGKATTIFA